LFNRLKSVDTSGTALYKEEAISRGGN